MPKVQHPAFEDIVKDVSDDELDAHLAAGWVVLAFVSERGPELDLPKGTRIPRK
jgi:hypothetical protein